MDTYRLDMNYLDFIKDCNELFESEYSSINVKIGMLRKGDTILLRFKDESTFNKINKGFILTKIEQNEVPLKQERFIKGWTYSGLTTLFNDSNW